GIYSAGGLILLETDAAVEQIRSLGITAVKSHPGCAAGAILAQKRGLSADRGDAVAIEQSVLIAKQAGIRYAGASPVDSQAPHSAEATLVFLDSAARRTVLSRFLPPSFY